MAIRFFVGCKDAPTEGAVQSKKLEFRNLIAPQIVTLGFSITELSITEFDLRPQRHRIAPDES
jgi:hypothetical protein